MILELNMIERLAKQVVKGELIAGVGGERTVSKVMEGDLVLLACCQSARNRGKVVCQRRVTLRVVSDLIGRRLGLWGAVAKLVTRQRGVDKEW